MDRDKQTSRSDEPGIDTATEPKDSSKTHEPELSNKPSQAEGDRETVLSDLRDKEAKGEL